MKSVKISLGVMMAFLLSNCGGGVIGNLVKWRDDNKNLAIECNVTMTKPGTEEVLNGNGDGSMHSVKNGNWDQKEKSEYQQWANGQCQNLLSFLQKSVNYKNAEIVDTSKIPVAETEFFGKKFSYADYTSTRFSYVWKMNLTASKSAEPSQYCKGQPAGCSEVTTAVNVRYLVEDWSNKESKMRSIPLQDPFFAICVASNESISKNLSNISDDAFKPLTSAALDQCHAKVKGKFANFQKEIDELNSKKKS
ncbi:MAG: hypothetical protein OEV66_05895 [Spirochaetia bacterium]|nr:hypothetical protein [Spirochaetia bacterium]